MNAILLLLLAASAANGTPSREELVRLAATPVTMPAPASPEIPVADWELAGPFPPALVESPHAYADPWGKMLEHEAASRPDTLVLTEDMFCFAREVARFELAHGGDPTLELRRFMAARCGSPEVNPGVRWIRGQDAGGKLELAWVPRFGTLLSSLQGNVLAGVAHLQQDGKSVVVLAWRQRALQIESASTIPDGEGRIEVRGKTLVPVGRLAASVNQGQYRQVACSLETKPPRFTFSCPLEITDASAWFELRVTPPGRFLSRPVLTALAWPGGEPRTRFQRPRYERSGPPGNDAAAMFVALLNEVRADAHLPPVRIAEAETTFASSLVPAYFAAPPGADGDALRDEIGRGLSAGWDVQGKVRHGTFTGGADADGDAGRLLASLLDWPGLRAQLLDPAISQVAVGTARNGEGLEALIVAYSLLPATKAGR